MSRSRRVRLLVCVATVLLVTAIAGLPAAQAAGASSGAPSGSSPQDFLEKAKEQRERIVQQATGCEGLTPPEQQECQAFRPTYARDHVVAGFRSITGARQDARAHGSRVLNRIGRTGVVSLDVPRGESVSSFLSELRKDPDVRFAEPDHRLVALGQTVEWGVRAIKADDAEATNAVTGDGVTVAVIDTGVDYSHPDLAGNIFINAGEDDGDGVFEPNGAADNNGVDDDGNGFVDDVAGFDFIGPFFTAVQPDNDPMDVVGHGTHVSGIVAAEDNTIGVRGVAPDATIMPVRSLDDVGAGWDTTIADGIYYAVDNGADIINMSLGGYAPSSTMRLAVEYARDNDVAVVAAAGNAFFYSLPSFPAAFPSVMSVSAAPDADPTSDDEELSKVWWSDWGHADFLAPGVEVLSTVPGSTNPEQDGYDVFSGTSMASPHVAGALALVQEEMEDDGVTPTPNKLEQALGATATDVYFAGKDEVSGAGVPDAEAATSLPLGSDMVQMYRSAYLIPSDGESESDITLRLLDDDGDPIAAEGVSWSTDKGALSDEDAATDGDGEATATLTVDDDFGSATVTADPDAHAAASVRVIVEDDRVRVDDIQILPPTGGDEFFFEEEGGEGEPGGIESAVPQPGDDVVLTAFLGRHNFEFDLADVSFEWTVTDPDGIVVDDLSGELDPVSVFGFGGQSRFDSSPMTVPFDAPVGKYHVEGTVTTTATGETHTLEKDFYIGRKTAEFLIVIGATVFDAETFNFLFEHITDSVVRRAVEDMDRTFTSWDTRLLGAPTGDVLLAHSNVIWLGGWTADVDLDAVEQYLFAGGNLLVSGDLYGTFARFDSSSTQYRDNLRAEGLLTTFFPDDNHQQYPATVTANDTGFDDLDPLAGAELDLDSYNLNHSGESTAIFTDELKLYDPDGIGAETLFEYPSGVNASNGGFEAGVVLDDGFSRVINLGFGIEAINDGATTLADVMDAVHDFFNPPPTIDEVFPSTADNSGNESFFVFGSNFQPTGKTKVYIGTRLVSPVVLDRGFMIVDVPAGMSLGTMDVKVVNPDGDEDTLAGAVTIERPAPRITDVDPSFGSNNRRRAFLVQGRYFRPSTKVYLAGRRLDVTYWSSHTLKAFLPAGFTPLGVQDVKVVNSDGKKDVEPDAYRVRFGFTFNFGPGASGTHVEWLQKRMKKYGYFPSSQPITGTYGSITTRAVRRFQNARDLTITGTVNSQTRTELNEKL